MMMMMMMGSTGKEIFSVMMTVILGFIAGIAIYIIMLVFFFLERDNGVMWRILYGVSLLRKLNFSLRNKILSLHVFNEETCTTYALKRVINFNKLFFQEILFIMIKCYGKFIATLFSSSMPVYYCSG